MKPGQIAKFGSLDATGGSLRWANELDHANHPVSSTDWQNATSPRTPTRLPSSMYSCAICVGVISGFHDWAVAGLAGQ